MPPFLGTVLDGPGGTTATRPTDQLDKTHLHQCFPAPILSFDYRGLNDEDSPISRMRTTTPSGNCTTLRCSMLAPTEETGPGMTTCTMSRTSTLPREVSSTWER